MTKLEDVFNIKDKTVLVTGAGGFFGRYFCRTLLENGARVLMFGRSAKTAANLKALGGEFGTDKVFAYKTDFYDSGAYARSLKAAAKDFKIDALVNNAFDLSPKTGFNTPSGRFENSTYAQWKASFDAGIYWAVLATQIVGGHMRKRGRGSIINMSSMYGIVSPAPQLYEGTKFFNPPGYGVVKSGLLALTRYTASFWGKEGVRANAIAAGPFSNTESESANSVKKGDPFLKRLQARTMLGRTGHPRELAGALIYLASDASSFMTGQTIVVDGGWTMI